MATATFWQRGETIDRINDTAKTIPANTIQAIGKRIGVVAMEAAPGQKYSVNVVGVYSFPKKASEAITAGADVYWGNSRVQHPRRLRYRRRSRSGRGRIN